MTYFKEKKDADFFISANCVVENETLEKSATDDARS